MIEMSKETSATNATIDTIIIVTSRMKELAQFYQEGLQLNPPQAQGDDHLGFPIAGTYLGLDQVKDAEFKYPGAVSIWFRVDDIEATFARFKELGAKVKYPPTKKPWGDTLAALYDPDGNLIGLAQR
jgi:hypothetical protein